MANKLFYSLVNGKKTWVNSSGVDVDFSTVSVSTDPTSGNHVVRKSFADATYIPLSQKGAANGVATLNANGKIPGSQLPALAITNSFVVNSEAEMLALVGAETGDVAIRTDISKSFILQGSDPSNLAEWKELLAPLAPVQSVNGQIGNVVLSTDDVTEGTSGNGMYFTEQRAQEAVVVDSLAVSGLTDHAPSVRAVQEALTNEANERDNLWQYFTGRLTTKLDKDHGVIVAKNEESFTIHPGQIVSLRYSEGQIFCKLAKADSLSTCAHVGVIVDYDILPNALGGIRINGEQMQRFPETIQTHLVPGEVYYVSATEAGKLTATPRTNLGDVIRPFVRAISNDGSENVGLLLDVESEVILA